MTQPYILYGDIGSGSAPVEMALAEIGAPVELRPVPLGADAQLAAEYRRINPMGRVPALVLPDGEGTVVTELLAILVTLAERHPEAGLLPPPGSTARAVALRWMAVLSGEFYPCVTRSDYPERFSADPAHAPAIRARAREMGREIWQVVEAGIPAPAPYLLGASLSVADLAIAVLSRWLDGRAWSEAALPKVTAIRRAVAARPACAPVWQRHFPEG